MLKIKKLRASVENTEILNGVDLVVKPGEIHVLMGPNGSGKSTLAQVIAGHPAYRVVSGECLVASRDIIKLTPDKRARIGIFLGMQHPVEVPGVSVFNFLRKAKIARSERWNLESSKGSSLSETSVRKRGSTLSFGQGRTSSEFRDELKRYMSELKLPEDFLRRSLNEGFSGGEKKRNEILQMMALKPKLVILDEIDSGLDVDGLKLVAQAIKKFALVNSRSSLVIITHYARILKYLKPDHVHVMVDGKIVESGGGRLANKVEEKGYRAWQTM